MIWAILQAWWCLRSLLQNCYRSMWMGQTKPLCISTSRHRKGAYWVPCVTTSNGTLPSSWLTGMVLWLSASPQPLPLWNLRWSTWSFTTVNVISLYLRDHEFLCYCDEWDRADQSTHSIAHDYVQKILKAQKKTALKL